MLIRLYRSQKRAYKASKDEINASKIKGFPVLRKVVSSQLNDGICSYVNDIGNSNLGHSKGRSGLRLYPRMQVDLIYRRRPAIHSQKTV